VQRERVQVTEVNAARVENWPVNSGFFNTWIDNVGHNNFFPFARSCDNALKFLYLELFLMSTKSISERYTDNTALMPIDNLQLTMSFD
jgi:hypothetical protein